MKPPASRSVFINCPFDAEYQPLFEALVFSIVACGFEPRCALENGKVSDPRMERVCEALGGSQYSIHDFSRCRGEGPENLARFNMPLEFGIAFGKRRLMAAARGRQHEWLVLMPTGHSHKQCVSDLGGWDPSTHDETVDSIVPPVVAWFSTLHPDRGMPTSQDVLNAIPAFQQAVNDLRRDWPRTGPPWHRLRETAQRVALETGLIVSGRASRG